ncbi:MAG: helix-turn-helix transcriptional regulator [Flavobacterium sp.]|nr:helix-turn-helix transcriptional regulator [Flavobacterium sp.]
MSVGTKIRKLRLQHKMSQEELAHKLNIAQTSISNFEANKSIPDFLVMQKVCEVFDVNFDYFSEDKKSFKVKKNVAGIVGDHATINNNIPEGILENMLKRIELLEKKMK